MSAEVRSNIRSGPDRELTDIADYVLSYRAKSRKVLEIARRSRCAMCSKRKSKRVRAILALCDDARRFEATPVQEFMTMLAG